jgi:hypothetical protein
MTFSQTLTVLFIGLKLTSFIAWPWVWVLSPVWIPLAFVYFLKFLAWLLGLISKD